MTTGTLIRSALVIGAIVSNSVPAASQGVAEADPLARAREIASSNEIVMIWSQGPADKLQRSNFKIYDLDLTRPVDQALTTGGLLGDSLIGGKKGLSVATGNFADGALKHIVAAWSTPDSAIELVVPDIEGATLSWSTTNREMLAHGTVNSKVKLAAGNFFGDFLDEFVLAYQSPDGVLHLRLFSFTPGSLLPQERGELANIQLMPLVSGLNSWDITAGDVNGDGTDEIVLASIQPRQGGWATVLSLFGADADGHLVAHGSRDVSANPAYPVLEINTAVAVGDFDHDTVDEIAFAFGFFQGEQSGPDSYLYLTNVSADLSTILDTAFPAISRDAIGPNEIESFALAAGDVNADIREEFVWGIGGTFYVYECDDTLGVSQIAQRGISNIAGNSVYSDHWLTVGDMDLDDRAEIVVAKNLYSRVQGESQTFEVTVFGIDSVLGLIPKARRLQEEPTPDGNEGLIRHWALAMGDFDGDRIRLGRPVHYRKTGVRQPTMILSTPPVHFDILQPGAPPIDLSGCYPGQACGFSASYVETATKETTLTTEIHEDWGADAAISVSAVAEARGLKYSFKEKLKATYGEKFSLRESDRTTYTVSIGRVASGDDWVCFNVFDIDFYEYPVYDSLNTDPIGYFLVSRPGAPHPVWVEGKDDDLLGNQYVPDHEVGNILSYPVVSTDDTARTIVDFPEQTIGSSGSSFVSLQISTFRDNSVETSWDAGLEVSASLGLGVGFEKGKGKKKSKLEYGVELEVSGRYGRGEISTQTVTVGNSLEMRAEFGKVQTQYGTGGTYRVQPYAYRDPLGTLVLDYKVSPLPSGPGSFWQQTYGGKPDLAFSLPWRFDLEKVISLPGNDLTYRQRSRDILISEEYPRPGDTVQVGAWIRNFGLAAVTAPVTVRFYRGDPASGGVLIGETAVTDTLPARGSRFVWVDWTVETAESPTTVRIYAVIDPQNQIADEVHEDNNTAWAPLVRLGSGTTGVEVAESIPLSYALYDNYPNPFNPQTVVRFDLPQSDNVRLEIFDLLGRRVATLLDERRSAGTHNVTFDAGSLASGVYLYRLSTGSFIQTRKMILLR